MAGIDWTILGPGQRGLAVEGKDDKLIIEAFLEAGERNARWSDWHSRLQVVETGKNDHVLRELKRPEYQDILWGIIDRDWRSDDQIAQMQAEYSHLKILPRMTIENYCIDPDELIRLLPDSQLATGQGDQLRKIIEAELSRWLRHGALSQIVYESGAYDFCRGGEGYPSVLLGSPIDDDADIRNILEGFRSQLDPETILRNCNTRTEFFQGLEADWYRLCINGKLFFNEVVVSNALKRVYRQQSRDAWITDLFASPVDCPEDLIPKLEDILS